MMVILLSAMRGEAVLCVKMLSYIIRGNTSGITKCHFCANNIGNLASWIQSSE